MILFKTKEDYQNWLTKHSIDENGTSKIIKSKEQINKDRQYNIRTSKEWHENNTQHILDESRKRQREIKQNTRILNEKYFAEERERLKQEEAN